MNTSNKSMRLVLTALALFAGTAALGASLSPIKPTVDHSKKATCGIKWTFNKSQAIKYFEIYRGVTEDFDDADLIAEVSNTTTRLTDWGADQYQNYYYWVIPFDYNDDSNVLALDLSRYYCENHRYWGSSDVYLTASVKTIAIGSTLPLYFKVNLGTSSDPVYDHVKPDRVVFTKMTDLNGREDRDIAAVYGFKWDPSGQTYSADYTYLKANGSFGYLEPYKPGVLYMRAYYRSATTVSPLRIEIKKPTFNLYAPEGEVDIVENNYRDLYLKCNGKFVCPDEVDRTVGDSVSIWFASAFETTNDNGFEDGLYDNSFGFLNMICSDETSRYDIIFNDMLVKEYEITPVWNTAKRLSFFFLDSNGRTATSFSANKTYLYGISYGGKPFPHKIEKYGYSWLTIYEEDSYSRYFWSWDLNYMYYESGVGNIIAYYDNLLSSGAYNQLGSFYGDAAGWVDIQATFLDRTLNDSIYIKGN